MGENLGDFKEFGPFPFWKILSLFSSSNVKPGNHSAKNQSLSVMKKDRRERNWEKADLKDYMIIEILWHNGLGDLGWALIFL